MLFKQNKLFPHPVLTTVANDYPGHTFSADLASISVSNLSLNIVASFSCTAPNLLALIRNKRAAYAVHFECSRPKYRKLFTSFDPNFSLSIPIEDVAGRVEYCTFIVAMQEIPDLPLIGAHSDYQDMSFSLFTGDILAIGVQAYFDVLLDYNPLRSLDSVFTITKDEDPSAPQLSILPDSDRLAVVLRSADYQLFTKLKSCEAAKPLLASLILFPALLQVLHLYYNSTDTDYSHWRWHKVLSKRINDKGLSIDQSDLPATANLLLNDILRDAFNSLEILTTIEEE